MNAARELKEKTNLTENHHTPMNAQPQPTRALVIVAEGISDVSLRGVGERTVLEEYAFPGLTEVAKRGIGGSLIFPAPRAGETSKLQHLLQAGAGGALFSDNAPSCKYHLLTNSKEVLQHATRPDVGLDPHCCRLLEDNSASLNTTALLAAIAPLFSSQSSAKTAHLDSADVHAEATDLVILHLQSGPSIEDAAAVGKIVDGIIGNLLPRCSPPVSGDLYHDTFFSVVALPGKECVRHCPQTFPKQSYRLGQSHDQVALVEAPYVCCHEISTRRDGVTQFTERVIREKGANLHISASHLIPEITYKIGKANKYGA
jgi:hypothetical protein